VRECVLVYVRECVRVRARGAYNLIYSFSLMATIAQGGGTRKYENEWNLRRYDIITARSFIYKYYTYMQ
jgi:hypothetical protein